MVRWSFGRLAPSTTLCALVGEVSLGSNHLGMSGGTSDADEPLVAVFTFQIAPHHLTYDAAQRAAYTSKLTRYLDTNATAQAILSTSSPPIRVITTLEDIAPAEFARVATMSPTVISELAGVFVEGVERPMLLDGIPDPPPPPPQPPPLPSAPPPPTPPPNQLAGADGGLGFGLVAVLVVVTVSVATASLLAAAWYYSARLRRRRVGEATYVAPRSLSSRVRARVTPGLVLGARRERMARRAQPPPPMRLQASMERLRQGAARYLSPPKRKGPRSFRSPASPERPPPMPSAESFVADLPSRPPRPPPGVQGPLGMQPHMRGPPPRSTVELAGRVEERSRSRRSSEIAADIMSASRQLHCDSSSGARVSDAGLPRRGSRDIRPASADRQGYSSGRAPPLRRPSSSGAVRAPANLPARYPTEGGR